MPAYVIANIDVKDPVRHRRLQENVADQHSAARRPLRRARRQVRRAGRVVDAEAAQILEFPNAARARVVGVDRGAPAKALRQATSTGDMVVIEGVGVREPPSGSPEGLRYSDFSAINGSTREARRAGR